MGPAFYFIDARLYMLVAATVDTLPLSSLPRAKQDLAQRLTQK